MIKVDNIFKKYGEKEILSDVSLELPKKKIISFIGSNGVGKSTLLSIITRTLSRDSGDVVIENKNLEEWSADYNNITIIDWHKYAKGEKQLFYKDATHPKPEGAKKYAEFILKSIKDKK